MSSPNNSANAATLQRDQSKGNKAKKRKLDFIEARDGWTKPKHVKNASIVDENDFVSDQPENVLDWVFAGKKVHEMREISRKTSTNKKKLFNNDNDGFKAMRLEKRLGHVPVRGQNKSQKTSAMCSHKRWTECLSCGVTLCCYGDNAETSCFKDFHVNQQLN
jgi:hypothetical protein